MLLKIFSAVRIRAILATRVTGLSMCGQFFLKFVLLFFGWLVSVEGQERLSGVRPPVIFALNHNNYFETLVVPCFLMHLFGQKISFLVHWMFQYFPVIGRLIRQIDPVWVYSRPVRLCLIRRRRPKKYPLTLQAAVLRLRSGTSLGVFPEGGRNKNPFVLGRAHRGLGEIALSANCPIIPVGIDFTARMKKKRIPLAGKIILRIGSPITNNAVPVWNQNDLPGTAQVSAGDHRLYNLAGGIVDRLMKELALLSGKEYRIDGRT